GRDILPLKDGLEALNIHRSMSPLWFGLFLLLPALGFFTAITVARMTRKDDTPARIMIDRARQALNAAASPDIPDSDLLSVLYRALVSAILGRQGIMGASLNRSEAYDHLLQIGWDANAAAEAAALIETIESLNYSGSTLDPNKRLELLTHTRQTVRRLAR
ncbi:MAG: hypothetical protein WBY88_17215, partial [Desulfosarcina sp.]